MKRRIVLLVAAWLAVSLCAAPAQAVSVHGGVLAAYEFFDANRELANDAQARLRQTYLLDVGGAVWAPEVATYRSSLRYDVVTESLEYLGGAFSDGVRSLTLEAKAFPYSPVNLALGASVSSTRHDGRELDGAASGLDEVGAYSRFWLGLAGLPPTSVQYSYLRSDGYRWVAGERSATRDVQSNNLSVNTTLRGATTQTQLLLQAGRTLDELFDRETLSRAGRVEFTAVPQPRLQFRAGAEVAGLDTLSATGDQASQRAALSARLRYQLAALESIQVAVNGSRSRQELTTGETEEYTAVVNGQYYRGLRNGWQGLLTADYGRVRGGSPADPTTISERERAALRGELSAATGGKWSWLAALGYEENANLSAGAVAQPGATAEGRVDYRWNPAWSLGLGASAYRSLRPEVTPASDPLGRLGLTGSVRWLGAGTGRAALSLAATGKEYEGARGQDTTLTLTAGASPRRDLDLTADLQLARMETPLASVAWQNTVSFSGAALYRPRSDWQLSLTLSDQESETPSGRRYQKVALLKSEYLFYALRWLGHVKLTQVQDEGYEPREALEISVAVRRDF